MPRRKNKTPKKCSLKRAVKGVTRRESANPNPMNFSGRIDVTAATAEKTEIGYCDTPQGRIDCVRKTYFAEDFDEISFNMRTNQDIIEKYGPKIYLIDDSTRSILFEFVSGETLENVLTKKINPWEADGLKTFKDIVKNVRAALIKLHLEGFCHDDVNCGNFIVQDDLNVRLIDFDTVRPISDDDCDDISRLYGHIEDALEDNIMTRKRLSQHRFDAEKNSIPEILAAAA